MGAFQGSILNASIKLSEQQKLFQEEMKAPNANISKPPLGPPLGDKSNLKASTGQNSALPSRPKPAE